VLAVSAGAAESLKELTGTPRWIVGQLKERQIYDSDQIPAKGFDRGVFCRAILKVLADSYEWKNWVSLGPAKRIWLSGP